jgi:hypothetical protein
MHLFQGRFLGVGMSRLWWAGASALALMGSSHAAIQTAAPAMPAAAPRAATPRAPLPVEAFAELPDLDDPALSPDGNQVAAKVAINGKQYFAVIKINREGPPTAQPRQGGLELVALGQ